jgi:hypothetical protein
MKFADGNVRVTKVSLIVFITVSEDSRDRHNSLFVALGEVLLQANSNQND